MLTGKKLISVVITSLGLFGLETFASDAPRGWRTNTNFDPLAEVQLKRRCAASDTITDGANRDWLSYEQANQRVEWAINCGHIADTSRRLFTHYLDDITFDWVPLPSGKMRYPSFAVNDASTQFPVWKPDIRTCSMPSNVIWLINCESGCYTQDQLVLFGSGHQTLPEAIEQGEATIMVMDGSQGFDGLSYIEREISYYTADGAEKLETVRRFTTSHGQTITVTKGHPLVDGEGYMRFAETFKKGEYLVRQDGSKAVISEIEDISYFGRVYNVAPRGHDAEANVVVGQGFLNGSVKFQEGTIRNFNRAMARQLIHDSILN
ncbi:hypothetical protein [Pseudobacteriovorax antillogorgiicola]|uniref:Intein N-terminal splicing region n=1 Tax=Pseudobacteriovorax antillogorgiicola TaxID=1513793 RepID=A0A1Y6BIW7_9BACT|nr:hypothetical protein [Pseudobacteriovorax antillogorgiicola]TCS57277.1 intein [Pseudobacteriovorax antillogorgiicola]SMF03172.1 intein N-terminal splicing region [Pseudobacteriovorax antillogorgiicola]